MGVEEAREDGRPVRIEDAVGLGIFGRVQVREAVVEDEDVGLAPFVQHPLDEDAFGRAERAVQPAISLQDGFALLQEEPAAGGEGDVSAAALEELAAGGFLQLGDVLADGRLADAQGLGGGRETADLRHLGKRFQTEIFEHALR